MKKLFSAFLVALFAVCLSLAFAACGNSKDEEEADNRLGESYMIAAPTQTVGDSCVIFRINNPKEENGMTVYCSLKHVFMNVSVPDAINAGGDSQLRINRGASASSFPSTTSYRYTTTLADVLDLNQLGQAGESSAWIDPFAENLNNGYKLSSWSYYKLSAPTHNLVINEIVFIGEVLRIPNEDGTFGEISSGGVPSGERRVLPVEIHSATPYEGQTSQQAINTANALIDAQTNWTPELLFGMKK